MDRIAEVKEFLAKYPHHPRSSKLIFELPKDDQRSLILSIAENSAFCDSWEAYFCFFSNEEIQAGTDVAYQAVQSVGLDPMSARLWISAANVCEDVEAAREIYLLGLSVPLFEWNLLYRSYSEFEEKNHQTVPVIQNEYQNIHEENWPDRYILMETDADVASGYQKWQVLIQKMSEDLFNSRLDFDLQCRRIDLALKQMCLQLPSLDVCFYQYALFQAKVLNDTEAAIVTLNSRMSRTNISKGLWNLLNVLKEEKWHNESCDEHFTNLILMRRLAERLRKNESDKGITKELRIVGKKAAAQGVCDWKLYSQWFQVEHLAGRDSRMAAKVLENGFICCSSSSDDAIFLSNEAIFHHVVQRNETEARSFIEKLLETCKNSQNVGRSVEAWNTVSKTEYQLGSFSSAEERRSNEFTKRPYLDFFLNKYRVGIISPCSSYAAKWLSFFHDFCSSTHSEHTTGYYDVTSATSKSISFTSLPSTHHFVRPDTSCWNHFTPEGKSAITDAENPDEVFGIRSYRGRLIYHLQLDEPTALRLKKQQRLRGTKKHNAFSHERDSPLDRLSKRLKSVSLAPLLLQRERSVSFAWIFSVVSDELNLNSEQKPFIS